MKDNISPEEKLLRLIRGSKKEAAETTTKEAHFLANAEALPSLSRKSGISPAILDGLAGKYFKYSTVQKYSRFLNIQFIIYLGFVIACGYLIISFVYSYVGLRKICLPKVLSEKAASSQMKPKQEVNKVKPYEYYLESIKAKQIFASAIPVSSAATAAVGSAIGVAGADIIKDINLVGIVTGENPQAIIEDKKTQKTYYVTKGQFISEFQVEDIQESKIILKFQGQNYELHL